MTEKMYRGVKVSITTSAPCWDVVAYDKFGNGKAQVDITAEQTIKTFIDHLIDWLKPYEIGVRPYVFDALFPEPTKEELAAALDVVAERARECQFYSMLAGEALRAAHDDAQQYRSSLTEEEVKTNILTAARQRLEQSKGQK